MLPRQHWGRKHLPGVSEPVFAHLLASHLPSCYRLWPASPGSSRRHCIESFTKAHNAVCLRLAGFLLLIMHTAPLPSPLSWSKWRLSRSRPTEPEEGKRGPPVAADGSACELPASWQPPIGLIWKRSSELRGDGISSCQAASLMLGRNNPRPQKRESFWEPFLISIYIFSSTFKMTVPLTSPLGNEHNSNQ